MENILILPDLSKFVSKASWTSAGGTAGRSNELVLSEWLLLCRGKNLDCSLCAGHNLAEFAVRHKFEFKIFGV